MNQIDLSHDNNRLGSKPPRSLISALISGTLLFLAFLLLLEGLFSWSRFDQTIKWRSLGVYHGQFEIKWFALKDFVRQNGGVDVLLLGNSMVNTGINPDILVFEYESRTGERLRVFNFGVEGLTVAPNSVIARILTEKYQPGTIIFFTEMRDYVAANGLEVERQLLTDEWVIARVGGKETLLAWLRNNSTVLQHLLPFRNWSRADFPDTFLMQARRFSDTSPTGYEADHNIGENIDISPDPANPEEKQDFELFGNFSIDTGRLDDLKNILEIGEGKTRVIITEMPVHPNFFTYFGGEQTHARYLGELIPFVTENYGIFLPSVPWQKIPMNGRVDHHHLNDTGAALFSRLLAESLADLCVNSNSCLLPATTIEVSP